MFGKRGQRWWKEVFVYLSFLSAISTILIVDWLVFLYPLGACILLWFIHKGNWLHMESHKTWRPPEKHSLWDLDKMDEPDFSHAGSLSVLVCCNQHYSGTGWINASGGDISGCNLLPRTVEHHNLQGSNTMKRGKQNCITLTGVVTFPHLLSRFLNPP